MSAQQIITQHLDIWTAAHKTRSSAGRGSSNKLDLYGIKKLRELILELAVRGKLVPQDPNDEPASELVRKIETEKSKLVKEGKIKKEKPLAGITDEEQPFDLPSNWQWTKLGLIGETNIGLTYKPSNVTDDGVPVLRSSNIQNGKIDLTDLVRVSGVDIKESSMIQVGDLLICARNGSKALVGKTAQIKELSEKTSFGAFMAVFRSDLNNYIEVFLNSPIFRKNLEGVDTTTINQITQGNLIGTLIPIPPLAEQHRIVAKVDELMAFCDQLEQTQSDNIAAHAQLVEALLASLTNSADHNELQTNWQRIAAHFDTLFTTEHSIDQLKQTILQLAVMGKLVPQNPNDEPASELLKKIDRELCQRIGESQLPKLERDKSTIDPSEFHWGIPDNWIWCELQDIALFENGKAHEQFVTEEDKYVLINSSFVSNSGEKVKYVNERLSPLEQGDMAIVMSDVPNGRALVRCYLVEANGRYTLNQRIGCLKFSRDVSKQYLHIVLNRNKYYLSYDDGKKQTNLKKVQVLSCPIPLPSVAEQHRIVTKVDELMTLCDTLKTNLQNAQTTQLALADALVEQAIN